MTKSIDYHIGNMGKSIKEMSPENRVYFASFLESKLTEKYSDHKINIMYGSGLDMFDKLDPREVRKDISKLHLEWKTENGL